MQCVSSEQDRRYKKITCTEQIAEIYKMILEHDREVFEELCGNLTSEQKKAIIQLTDIIMKGIDTE